MDGEINFYFILIILFFFVGLVIFNFTLYLLRAYGIYVLAKNNGFENKKLYGYVPFLSDYFVHELSTGNRDMSKNTVGVVTLISGIASIVFGSIFSLAYVGSYIYACNELFKKINPEKSDMNSIINIITLGCYSYVYIFVKRNTILEYDVKSCVDSSVEASEVKSEENSEVLSDGTTSYVDLSK